MTEKITSFHPVCASRIERHWYVEKAKKDREQCLEDMYLHDHAHQQAFASPKALYKFFEQNVELSDSVTCTEWDPHGPLVSEIELNAATMVSLEYRANILRLEEMHSKCLKFADSKGPAPDEFARIFGTWGQQTFSQIEEARHAWRTLTARIFVNEGVLSVFFDKWEILKAYLEQLLWRTKVPRPLRVADESPEMRRKRFEQEAADALKQAAQDAAAFQKHRDDGLRQLRECLCSKALQKLKYRDRENCRRNAVSAFEYVEALFNKYSRVLVGRIDLSFKSDADKKPTQKVVHTAFRRFLNKLRHSSVGRDVVGYIWTLEYGMLRGYHYHVMFFLDSSKRHKHEHLVQEIGNMWAQLNQGQGVFHNCNRETYTRPFLGVVSHDDVLARFRVLRNIFYLCKKEQLLRVKVLSTVNHPDPEAKAGQVTPDNAAAVGAVPHHDEILRRGLIKTNTFGKGQLTSLTHSGLGRRRRSSVPTAVVGGSSESVLTNAPVLDVQSN